MDKSGNAEEKSDQKLRKIWHAQTFLHQIHHADIHFNFGFVKFRVKQKKRG